MSDFFIAANDVPNFASQGHYTFYLVFLSYFVASFGSLTGLMLAINIANARNSRAKNLSHIGGALVFGSAIWSMHFIGMLAYKMDMAVNYDLFLTGISFFIAVFSAFVVLYSARLCD